MTLQPLESFTAVELDRARPVAEQIAEFGRQQIADILRSLLNLSKFANSEAIRLDALKTLLAHCAPPPARGAAPAIGLGEVPRDSGPIPLGQMTPEELDAVRVLQLGLQRRRGDEE